MSGSYKDLRQLCLSSLMENIKDMKYSDLQDLLNNEEYQKTLVETLPEVCFHKKNYLKIIFF